VGGHHFIVLHLRIPLLQRTQTNLRRSRVSHHGDIRTHRGMRWYSVILVENGIEPSRLKETTVVQVWEKIFFVKDQIFFFVSKV